MPATARCAGVPMSVMPTHLASSHHPNAPDPGPPPRPRSPSRVGIQDDDLLFSASKDDTWFDVGGYTDWADENIYKSFKASLNRARAPA
jgi:hypothetical protein